MTATNTIAAIARQSLSEPRPAAANLMALGIPMPVVWNAFILVNILSVLLAAAMSGFQLQTPPILAAAFATGLSLASVVLIVKIGQALGGHGTFADALLLTTFLSAIFLAGQLFQLVLLLVLPPLAGLFGIALILFGAWLNINFIAAVHGFTSLWRAVGTLALGSLVLAMIVLFFMSMTGNIPGAPV